MVSLNIGYNLHGDSCKGFCYPVLYWWHNHTSLDANTRKLNVFPFVFVAILLSTVVFTMMSGSCACICTYMYTYHCRQNCFSFLGDETYCILFVVIVDPFLWLQA